jgi:hypothetical protein
MQATQDLLTGGTHASGDISLSLEQKDGGLAAVYFFPSLATWKTVQFEEETSVTTVLQLSLRLIRQKVQLAR